ncbi:MAG TPA: hypothetical protein VK464_03270 [Symbiobacteriaceae bacterium]|nr:hypothetical protein [Symbiobacteriaceae bacterium]
MEQRKRSLVVSDVSSEDPAEFQAVQAARYAACPEAARFTDEEVQEFLGVAQYIDAAGRKYLVDGMRMARLSYPPELAVDPYRLGRHILRRWQEPGFREAFLGRAIFDDYGGVAKLKRKCDLKDLITLVDTYGPGAFFVLRRHGMDAQIPIVTAALDPDRATWLHGAMCFARLLMHRYLTQPEPARRSTPWEQQKVARRIHLRDIQLRSLRRNLRQLTGQRKRLLAELRASSQIHPELPALASELAQLKAARLEAERRHQAALEEQARHYQTQLAPAQAELAAARAAYDATLTLRRTWLPISGR